MLNLKPAFNNDEAICFSINDKYAPLLATTIASIVENASSNQKYDIVILYVSLSEINQKKIASLTENHNNFSIRFFDVSEYVDGYNFYTESDLTNSKYTFEIYFRLIAPTIFDAYKKLIYLDADLIFEADVAELYNVKFNNNLIAAVRDYEGIAVCYNNNYERTKYRINELGIKNFNDYFISGVVIINVPEFNKLYSIKDLLEFAASKDWKQYDQDLLNFLCKDRIVILGAEWDFVEDIYNIYGSLPTELFNEYTASELSPKIIHYSAKRKPWINVQSKFAKNFWKYAKLTPYYQQLQNLLTNSSAF